MRQLNRTCLFLSLMLICCYPLNLYARNSPDSSVVMKPTLSISYLNTSNDSLLLTASVDLRTENGFFALQNAPIDFLARSGDKSLHLGNALTNESGKAVLKVYTKSILPKDKEGKTLFLAAFSGKGKYLPAIDSLSTKSAQILVSFSEEDSVRNIIVTAAQQEKTGAMIPIKGLTVSVYIPRLFSNLKIGEITLEDDGTGKLECPKGLVGDSTGNLVFIARIEEDDLFNTVQGQSSISWGDPKQYYLAEMPSRELWTPIAPLWMIVTLIVMLAGVWGHYIYAVIQLIIIRRLSRQKKM